MSISASLGLAFLIAGGGARGNDQRLRGRYPFLIEMRSDPDDSPLFAQLTANAKTENKKGVPPCFATALPSPCLAQLQGTSKRSATAPSLVADRSPESKNSRGLAVALCLSGFQRVH